MKKGWSVIQSPGETYFYHEDSGTLISDVLCYEHARAAQPSLKDGSQPMELVKSSVVEPEGLKVSMVGAVEPSCQVRRSCVNMFFEAITRLIHTVWNANREEEFLEHQGEVCVRILEVQVDFFFLGLVESKFKMILLCQVFSG